MNREELETESTELRIPRRKLRDWLFTGGAAAVLLGLAWMWPPLALVAAGLAAMALALRGSPAK